MSHGRTRSGFGPAICRARSDLRRSWYGVALLALLTGTLAGGLLAAASGARRTASAFDRLAEATRAPDAVVMYSGCGTEVPDGSCTAEEDEALGGVGEIDGMAAASVADLYLGAFRLQGGKTLQELCLSGSSELGVLARPELTDRAQVARPVITAGRAADPSRVEEVTVNLAAARSGVRVGDVIEAELGPFCPEEGSPPPTPIDLRVVGIAADTLGVQPEAGPHLRGIYATPAFHRWARSERIVRSSAALVRLEPGTSVGSIVEGKTPLEPVLVTAEQRKAVDEGIRRDVTVCVLIALLGLLGTALVLVPVIVRVEQRLLTDAPLLRTLGFDRSDLRRLGSLHGLAIGASTALVAVLAAGALSVLTPVGLARSLEVAPGVDLDGLVLGVGAVAVMGAVAAVCALTARRAGGAAHLPRRRPSRVAGAASRTGAGPVLTLGARLAFEHPGAASARAGSRVAAQVIAVGALAGSMTFLAGLEHLEATPRLVGWNWDAIVFAEGRGEAEIAALRSVAQVTPGTLWAGNGERPFRVGRQRIPSWVLSAEGGADELTPTVIDGRAPLAKGELLVHPDLLSRLGLDIGDRTTVGWGERSQPVTIVGTGVFILDVGQFESGSAMTLEGLQEVSTASGQGPLTPEVLLVRFVAGADPAAEMGRLVERGVLARDEYLAADEVAADDVVGGGLKLDRVGDVPRALGYLSAALAAAVLVFLVVDRMGEWRREMAVYRSLGVTARQARAAVVVGSLALGTAVGGVGIVVGVAVGRLVWEDYAARLGVKPESVVPTVPLAGLLLGAALVALLAALHPAWRVTARRPAELLRVP